MAQLLSQAAADFSGDVGVLKKKRALEKLAAVQAGPQHEVAVKQRARFPE